MEILIPALWLDGPSWPFPLTDMAMDHRRARPTYGSPGYELGRTSAGHQDFDQEPLAQNVPVVRLIFS